MVPCLPPSILSPQLFSCLNPQSRLSLLTLVPSLTSMAHCSRIYNSRTIENCECPCPYIRKIVVTLNIMWPYRLHVVDGSITGTPTLKNLRYSMIPVVQGNQKFIPIQLCFSPFSLHRKLNTQVMYYSPCNISFSAFTSSLLLLKRILTKWHKFIWH